MKPLKALPLGRYCCNRPFSLIPRRQGLCGSAKYTFPLSGAQYLLLHSHKGATSSRLLRVSREGPRVLSRDALKDKGYPDEPSKPFYLVYDVAPAEGFEGYEWDYRKLPERLQNRQSAEPQTITLDALMAVAEGNLLAEYTRHG